MPVLRARRRRGSARSWTPCDDRLPKHGRHPRTRTRLTGDGFPLLAIIGAGDVVRNRYARGLERLATESGIGVGWVFDITPVDDWGPHLAATAFRRARFQRLPENLDHGAKLIAATVPPTAAVVVATPTLTHIPYAVRLIGSHRCVVVEKPLSPSLQERAAFYAAVAERGARFFPLEYYLLEKGLPLFLSAQAAFRRREYLDLVTPVQSADTFRSVAAELGRPTRVRACILEGQGPAATLSHRPWVFRSGGNTWETLIHLTCLLSAIFDGDLDGLRIKRSYVSRVDGLEVENAAGLVDTAHLVHGEIAGAEIVLVAAKNISPSAHQRWFEVEYRRGLARMDFETSEFRAVVPSRGIDLSLRLRDRTPYVTQFTLLERWLADDRLPLPILLYERAMQAHQRIHDAGLAVPIHSYRPDASVNDLFEAAPAARQLTEALSGGPRL